MSSEKRELSRIEQMLVSTSGVKWREVQVVAFTVYLDDSGTSPSQHAAIATAAIFPAIQIKRMESEWDTLKRKEGFADFHTSEFIARNEKSEFHGWEDEKCRRVFSRVRQITKKYGTVVWSFAVNKKDYDEVVPAEYRRSTGQFHYSWAIRHVLTFLEAWRLSQVKIPAPFEFVFDSMGKRTDPRRVEVEKIMAQAEDWSASHGRATDYRNYSFRDRKNIAGLQCTDSLAWSCYQLALFKFRGTPLSEWAKAAWDDFSRHMGQDKWLKAITVTREDLKTWVDKEVADGTSMKWFEQWEKIHAARNKALTDGKIK